MISKHEEPQPEDRFIGMFSYGSNNEQQLRARVDSPRLRGRPAFLDGYVRVFGFSSPPWAGGSVASVARKAGGRVYGRFYLMTPREVEILDIYECVKQGGYSKEAVLVNVRLPKEAGGEDYQVKEKIDHDSDKEDGSSDDNGAFVDVLCSAITYVMLYPHVGTFVPPSPQYLTAVYRTMTSSFPELSDQAIEVCDHTGSKMSEWTHPGIRALPLEAFLLEVGLREEPSWTFPTVLRPLVARLAAAGILTTDDLCEAVTNGVLLSRLAASDGNGDQAGAPAGSEDGAAAAPSPKGKGARKQEPSGREEASEWAEVARKIASRATVPDFTEQTLGIIARIVTGECT
ncbi:unnamed protein product [Scytosiphon promiscuus]